MWEGFLLQIKLEVTNCDFKFEENIAGVFLNSNLVSLTSQIVISKIDWIKCLKSQFATSKIGRGGRRSLPSAFTEHGVLMLSSVLNSARAIQVNIQVMRIFTQFRKHVLDHSEFSTQLKEMRKQLQNNTQNIELVFQYLDELEKKNEEPKPRKRIGYKSDDL